MPPPGPVVLRLREIVSGALSAKEECGGTGVWRRVLESSPFGLDGRFVALGFEAVGEGGEEGKERR